MSCYLIFYKDGAKMMRPVTSREEYIALRSTPRQKSTVDGVRQGKTLMKRKLLQFNYSCLPLAKQETTGCGPLKGCTTPSNTVGMDVDLHRNDYANDEVYQKALAAIPEKVMAKKDELGLLMLERSATKGYHLAFWRKPELTQEENLRWASDLLGVEYDAGAKDITRVFFSTTASEEDLIFLSDGLFEQSSVHAQRNLPQQESPLGSERRLPQQESQISIPKVENPSSAETTSYPSSYNQIPYALIIAHLETLLGGKPEHGARNNHIFAMACNLRYICNHDADWVISICPTYGEARDKASTTIRSACNRAQSITMSDTMKRALAMASAEYQLSHRSQSDENGDYRIAQPKMPDVLPRFVEEAIAPFPDYQRPALALACFTPLMAYFSGTRFRYIDNTWMEPSSMFVLAGGAGKGKGGHKILVEAITRLMKEQDEENKLRDEEWKKCDKETAENRKHKARPEDICYQKLCGDVTTSALTQRQGDCHRAGGKFIYSYFSEASMLKGVASDLAMLVKIAYDCDERGAARSSSKGESGEYPLRWNFSVSCNKTVLHKTFNFSETLHDGTLQRLTFAVLPERKPEAGARGRDLVPRYKDHDEEYDRQMRAYAEKVQKVKGDFESPAELTELSFCRCDDKYDIYQNADDQFFEDYGNRTIAIAHKIGFTLWVLNDMEWSPVIEEFVTWAFWYMMWAKCVLLREAFYASIEGKGFDTNGNPGPRNMLTQLKNRFAISDLIQLRRQEQKSIDEEDVRHQIAVWLNRGHITEVEMDVYEKVNFRS